MFAKTFSQVRGLETFLLWLYFPPLLFLIAMVLASIKMDVSMGVITGDPASIMGMHPFVGVGTKLGVLLWSASATICLFSWALLRNDVGAKRFSTFLLCSGLMTTLLLLDDLFLLHEIIYPRHFGITETTTFLGYGGLTLCGIVMFRKCILKTEYLILLIALGFFGLSLLIDGFQHRIDLLIGHWRILLEDGFKILGIVGWFGYFLRCCLLANRVSKQ